VSIEIYTACFAIIIAIISTSHVILILANIYEIQNN